MTAIITDIFKKQLVQNVFDEVTATVVEHRYYIGIGKSEEWDSSETVPAPTDTPRTIRNLRAGLQSIKSASDVSYTIPRYNWSSGAIYQGYNDDVSSIPTNTYYILTEDNQVYICLQQGKSSIGAVQTSTVKPSGTLSKAFKTADGYVWKFLYTLSATRTSKFLSSNFLPIEKILDSAGGLTLTTLETQQAVIQDAAVPGQILGIAITSGGSGYDSGVPSITINGDGFSAAATAFINGGQVVKIELDSSTDSGMTMGRGYNFASIAFGAGNATARPIIGPKNGIGFDPRDELKSTSLMFNTKPSGIEDGNFIVGQDFRQVALIRDPKQHTDSSTAVPITTSSGRVLKYLQLQAAAHASFLDTIITGDITAAKAHVDEVDSDRIYFHQSELTGFKPFNEGEGISGGGQSGTLIAAGGDSDSNAFTTDDVDNVPGQILYIENRAPITRSLDQTEDLKIVITL